MTKNNNHMLGHTLLRVTVGLLFLIMGLRKFSEPGMIIGMLGNLGFPAVAFLGWLLILSEIVFGALILIGYKVKYTAWPLAIILAVAWLTVTVPTDGIGSPNSFFHLIGISGLITIALTGPGKWAASKVR
jgi:putative oxidoreductase